MSISNRFIGLYETFCTFPIYLSEYVMAEKTKINQKIQQFPWIIKF